MPFFALLLSGQAQPRRRDRGCPLILFSRLAESAWLVMPDLPLAPPLWLVAAAVLALGGLMLLLFLRRLRYGRAWPLVFWTERHERPRRPQATRDRL